jgi:hypothetical protein
MLGSGPRQQQTKIAYQPVLLLANLLTVHTVVKLNIKAYCDQYGSVRNARQQKPHLLIWCWRWMHQIALLLM